MANAALASSTSYGATIAERRAEASDNEHRRRPVTERVYQGPFRYKETTAQRQERHARETGTRPCLWK